MRSGIRLNENFLYKDIHWFTQEINDKKTPIFVCGVRIAANLRLCANVTKAALWQSSATPRL